MNKCDKCGKLSRYDGLVWYSDTAEESNLCLGCMRKWNKQNKPFMKEHSKTKPCTKAWYKMCKAEQRLYDKWLKRED